LHAHAGRHGSNQKRCFVWNTGSLGPEDPRAGHDARVRHHAAHTARFQNEVLRVEEGSLYPALHRMEQDGWIRAE